MKARRTLLFVILSCIVIGCDEPDLGRFSNIERRVSKLGTWGISATSFGVEKSQKEKNPQFLYQLIYVFERNPGRITENIRDGTTVTVEGRDFIADDTTKHSQFVWNRDSDEIGIFNLNGSKTAPRGTNNIVVVRLTETSVTYEYWGYASTPLEEEAILSKLKKLNPNLVLFKIDNE
jgi:hypothetical protein